ncbi:MAG: flagellar hook-length control protein FliK [Planctomycetota bacterium]
MASPTRDSATPTGRVSAPRPTPDLRRAAEVLDQLKAAIRPGLRRAVVQLEPGDLGTVTIRIAVARGSVSGRIEVERPETLELVERHAPELRAALADAGLEVGELDVALGRDSGASNPGEAADGQRPAGSQRAPAAEPTEHRSSPRPTRLDPDGVDFYA